MPARGGGVLVISGDGATALAAREAGSAAGLEVRVTAGLGEGLRALSERRWSVTVLSLDLGGVGGELVGRVAREETVGALVLSTVHPTLELAMEATRLGARELVGAPVGAEVLARLIAECSVEGPRVRLPEADPGRELVGASPPMLDLFKVVGRVAGSAATVLLTGESGTGKEVVARAIHRLSPRAAAPFVAVNCAAIPEDLLESELFGHEKGAFTGAVARKMGRFERAQGGTLFLDEIGDMSLVLQAKILRALQEREIERLGGEERLRVDVRVVAATHRDLAARIQDGDFREDLYYRLAVVRLHLPGLRERGTDLRELVLHYTAVFAAEHARPLRWVEPEALERLEGHRWPGNVRELRNVLERAVLVAQGETLRAEDLEIDPGRDSPGGEALPGYSADLSMAEVEALHIRRVLAAVDGHLGRAAEVLGMHRNTVSRKAQEYGLIGRG